MQYNRARTFLFSIFRQLQTVQTIEEATLNIIPFQVPCSKMMNCKNGGKTIIDLQNGPGSDPYRCECLKGFKGDLCGICKFKFNCTTCTITQFKNIISR